MVDDAKLHQCVEQILSDVGGAAGIALVRIGDTQEKYAWRLWSLDWPAPAPGDHTITARAIGADGSVRPAPTDLPIAGKHTYWESNGQITRHIRLS